MRRCRVCATLGPEDGLKQGICLGCRREYREQLNDAYLGRFDLRRRPTPGTKSHPPKAVKPDSEWLNGRAIQLGRNLRRVPRKVLPTAEDVERAIRLLSSLLPNYEDEPL